ncbi:MAG: ammonia-forming cytochrome c nitrite reductase subunit c552 [Coriobacteriia bacterium]|nr:ammonia-forming cytochrome c nitrite reductase subunit c552 [Coriobacteriia bacterium]
MKKVSIKTWIVICMIVSMVVLVGCSLGRNEAPRYFGEFKDLYPNQYASFISGGTVKDADGQIHSHAATRFHTESSPVLQDIGAPCLSCKTGEFNTLFERYGEDIYNMGYSEISGEVVDFFSCRTCHATGVPADGAGAVLEPFVRFASDYIANIDPKIAACGQCHNATCDWPRYLISKDMTLDEAAPYRYGTDADSLRRAAEEDGIYIRYDKELLTPLFYLGHPDIELFMGSKHQQLGLSCVSCHMPYEDASDGSTFRSHNSSGSPIYNENAMSFCLTCHKAQGIATTVEMRNFIWQKQKEMADREKECEEKLATLRALIIARTNDGTVSEAVLAQARESYQTANYYCVFQHAGGRSPGVKAAHSADVMRAYLKQSIDILDQAIAALR